MYSIDQFLKDNKNYLRNPQEPDRVFTKGKKIEVVYAIVSKGIPLFRTEGAGDVTLLEIKVGNDTISVPAILPEKIQAKLRRQALEILRGSFNDKIKNYIAKYKDLGFSKIGTDNSWNCYVAPPIGERETDIGMCGFCPSCNIFGAIITDKELDEVETSYGLKSRVVHDIAFAAAKYEKTVVDLTHNKVGDGVNYTGRALFEEPHIVPGVVFIGKLAMFDVTEREARLVLLALSNISRMGGGETKYGSVQTIVIGLKAGDRETISSYDILRYILEKTKGDLETPETIIKNIVDYVKGKGFKLIGEVENIGERKKIDELTPLINIYEEFVDRAAGKLIKRNFIEALWEEDNLKYSEGVVKYIQKVEKGEEKSKKETRGKGT